VKNTTAFAFVITLVCSTILSLNSQNIDSSITISIEDIPKSIYESNRRLGVNFTAINNSKNPIHYKLNNDSEAYTFNLKPYQTTLNSTLDLDLVFLKLPLIANGSKTIILRRGDDISIKYSDKDLFIAIKNRTLKKHDIDVSDQLNALASPLSNMDFYFKKKRSRTKAEKQQAVKLYDKKIAFLDSLSRNQLLSNQEYQFYRKKLIYERELQLENFTLAYLKEPDLHVDGFDLFMRQYVFSNLKKKIISLGNGAARNSLEAFDFVYASKSFSEKNKQHLLFNSLKNIKIDFSKAQYQNRYKKYQSLVATDNAAEELKTNNDLSSKAYDFSKNVDLIDSDGQPISLRDILDKNKGKVVYIDFWASWCAPCRKAFPAYRTLKQTYKDENIAFVFISGDTDMDNWKRAETQESLDHSFLAMNFPDASFYEQLNIRSFPRYLIFDTNGHLVRDNAPGPNSDNIKLLIDELLNL